MSSTRTAKDKSVFQQARFASSPEFDRGLIANLVARRCSVLESKADRELVWFIQYLSHREGGAPALAKDLISQYHDRLQTRAMAEIGMKPGKMCNAEQVRKIRKEMDWEDAAQFPLKGDSPEDDFSFDSEALLDSENRTKTRYVISEDELPTKYLAEKFSFACQNAAKSHLENCLRELCLDPAESLKSGPWYFPGLITTLREYQADYIKTNSAGEFTTELGRKVSDVLDYTAYCRGLTLIQGEARLGKSHAAKAWCSQHPGNARFLEVPDGADDASFFRDMARGLGLGNFLNYKVVQIRERVESVLLTGDLVLVLDEAHRLWPQTHFRAGYPKRMVWVMTMANAGVPICMISTNQFFATQKVIEKNGWNSAQLTGRISHYECLPSELSPEDLIGVAKAILPEADAKTLRALAAYARSSSRYLAAIDSITKRASYVAQRAGRNVATTDDVRTAMLESVIPADTKLHRMLESVGKGKLARITPAPALPPDSEAQETAPEVVPDEFPPTRSRVPALTPEFHSREGNRKSLLEAQTL